MQTDEQRRQEERRHKLSEWLSPIVPSARHFENQKQRAEQTGRWLLEDVVFHAWLSLDAPQRTLFCYGDPGAGKTIISYADDLYLIYYYYLKSY